MYVCIRFSPCNMRIFSFRDSVFVDFEVGGIIGSGKLEICGFMVDELVSG